MLKMLLGIVLAPLIVIAGIKMAMGMNGRRRK